MERSPIIFDERSNQGFTYEVNTDYFSFTV